jgi:ParD-like antitoxin of type II ParDE toxin-antitoxin system
MEAVMTTKSIRLSTDLIFQAQSASTVQHRSIPNQVEYWATLGRIISSIIGIEDAFAILQGLKKLRVEPTETNTIDSDTVLNNLEADRAKGFVDKPITSAAFYFETSQKMPGLLDRVNSLTGERKTGKFADGKFREINA